MATFDTLIDDLAGRFGLGVNARTLVKEVLTMISTSPGGLGGFLDKLKSTGLTSEVGSWLGRPDAAPCFEVIRVKQRGGFEIEGRFVQPAEVYPASKLWGTDGFTLTEPEDVRRRRIPVANIAGVVGVDDCIRAVGDEALAKSGGEFRAHRIRSCGRSCC